MTIGHFAPPKEEVVSFKDVDQKIQQKAVSRKTDNKDKTFSVNVTNSNRRA